MKDRLTYRDYFLSQKKGNVILTQDGRLFASESMHVRSEILRYLVILDALILFSPLLFDYGMAPNSYFDLFFVCGTLTYAVFLLMPRLLRFTELKPDSPAYQEAQGWFAPQNGHVNKASFLIIHALIAAVLLIFLLSGHLAELAFGL